MKITVIGNQEAGKSSILRKFMLDEFYEEYEQTIGGEFSSHIYQMEPGLKVRLQMWDTSGDLKYR
eukprot:CAMPEP_0202972530 /NCGR_PEP_ID=MMETSP1396-20130829/37352_1 /ASSEMBLY_ACC=CAM_ASM_000872 /TAXON_ID= /ORGANISM="Pseudokeronopsis sp., Strain Brazil" /LENGTH=64 /DNA_ID=CAMNT_0049703045 /DNA_START=43 /DNA_END=237 /DNA_ORIENTATION=+